MDEVSSRVCLDLPTARPPKRSFHLVFESHDGRACVPIPERSTSPRVTLTPLPVDSLKALDPNVWTRRALQGKIVRLESVVSHQCIRPRIGADAPGHHGNPRTPDLITGHASKGYLGSSVLGCAGKTICPSTLFSRGTSVGRSKGVTSVSPCCERLIGDCSRRLRYAA